MVTVRVTPLLFGDDAPSHDPRRDEDQKLVALSVHGGVLEQEPKQRNFREARDAVLGHRLFNREDTTDNSRVATRDKKLCADLLD